MAASLRRATSRWRRRRLAGAQAQSTDLRIARATTEHAIAVLIGRTPAEFSIPVTKIEAPPPPIPVAMPSLLLERRPDIAAGERQVASANANIGIAQTAYYPTLDAIGHSRLAQHELGEPDHVGQPRVVGWSVGFADPVRFRTPRRYYSRRSSLLRCHGGLLSRRPSCAAFQEVEDDLATLRYLAEEAVQQQEAVVAAEQALDLELARYRAGTDSYLNVITTQTIALSDEQAAVSILQRRMLAAVDLVKALGGGWDASTLPTADQLRSAALANPDTTKNVAQPVNR